MNVALPELTTSQPVVHPVPEMLKVPPFCSVTEAELPVVVDIKFSGELIVK